MDTSAAEQRFRDTWAVLVEECGAAPSGEDDFVFLNSRGRCDEYRFIGALGFGGKFWRHDMRVSCYREDETPERLAMMRRANARIAELPEPPMC